MAQTASVRPKIPTSCRIRQLAPRFADTDAAVRSFTSGVSTGSVIAAPGS